MARISRVEGNFYGTAAGIAKEHPFPGFAAIDAFVHATLFCVFKQIAHSGHKNDIWVGRVYAYSPNMLRFFKPDMLPGLATINRLPHAKTTAHVTANSFFALTNVNNVMVAFTYGYSANTSAKKAIRNAFPGIAGICGTPNATTCAAKIKQVGLAGHASNRTTAAASKRTEIAPG